MSATPQHPLAGAFDLVTGRRTPAAAPQAEVHWASEVLEARQQGLAAPPCPTAVLRRAQALLHERRAGALSHVLQLAFDSWSDAVPALRGRGHGRHLRFEGPAGALDVQVVAAENGGTHLDVAAEAAYAHLTACVVVPPARRGRPVPLDSDGSGRVELGRAAREAIVIVSGDEGELFRTPRLPLK